MTPHEYQLSISKILTQHSQGSLEHQDVLDLLDAKVFRVELDPDLTLVQKQNVLAGIAHDKAEFLKRVKA